MMLTGGRLRRPAQLCGPCLAASQNAAIGTNAALDLRAGKVEWHGCAELHPGLMLRIIMRLVIIEEAG